jgi:hypothetical protein
MPLSLFAMMDSVMTLHEAVRCGKSRPGVAKPPGRGAQFAASWECGQLMRLSLEIKSCSVLICDGTELELCSSVGKLGGRAMATESECIEYARECVRLAGLTDDPDIRDRLLEIARDWMAAAMGEDEAAAPSISASESLSNEAA